MMNGPITDIVSSLAGDYLVRCQSTDRTYLWSMVPLHKVTGIDESFTKSEGARAWAALDQEVPSAEMEWKIEAIIKGEEIEVLSSIEHELSSVLSRIIVQWAISNHASKSSWTISLPDGVKLKINGENSDETACQLFDSICDIVGSEMVEMVDRNGNALGRVPRKLVHVHNLLHRGIGLFVTKDRPIQPVEGAQPDLYTHQRTSTKRIFPSLYDMFVGGVSLAGEDPAVTARREVAEELGLTKGTLTDKPLLRCVVCTAYNRVVVDVFCYTMEMANERVQWQEEEVAWGSFVPYDIIEAAADRSIQRLAERNEWPSRYPPIQSRRKGVANEQALYDGRDWKIWDFVPDGLLVWEAWLRLLLRES